MKYKFTLKEKKKNKFVHMVTGLCGKRQRNPDGQFYIQTYELQNNKCVPFENTDITKDVLDIIEKNSKEIIRRKVYDTIQIITKVLRGDNLIEKIDELKKIMGK